MLLSAEETRVLGALVEKALATPASYPLTEAAVLAACNQATNRDPIVDFDIGTVRRALRSLREQGLAREVHRPGDRAAKHRHLLDEALDLDPPAQAVLAVLLLRGAQTVAELRARTERLHRFPGRESVEHVLEDLEARQPDPIAELLPRRPGQKEVRWVQRLTDPDALPEQTPVDESPPGAAATAPVPPTALTAAVEELRAEVAALRAEVSELRTRTRGDEASAGER